MAAPDGAAKRLVVFFSPNGTVHEHWRPSGSGADYAFPAGSVLEPLQDFREKLIVCDGLDFVAATNHEGGMAAMLTGQGAVDSVTGGKSLDQFVAAELGAATKFPSLEFGVITSPWGSGVQTRMSNAGPAQFVTPDDSPASVYDRMFADAVGGEEAATRLRARRERIVDLLVDEVSTMKSQLGAQQRIKLDAHLSALATLEQGLQAVDCDAPTAPMALDPIANDNFPVVGRAQMDLLVMSLLCDMTRVASIQWSHTVGPVVFSWLGVGEGHHSLSHIGDQDVAGVGRFIDCERWYAEQFAYLLGQLDALPDPDGEGSMLDTTVVLWAKELGDGRLHECLDVPFVVAGGGDCFDLGRYVDFGGAPHNQLLVSICQAMGLSNDTFGNPAHGSGALPGLVSQ
ncbi:MAG: DUF1552 domain-containing protein [Nannocystaceae bacterium]|nr:DUF1552 domain-containing protein [Nannocystaceae bacterium]